MAAFAALGSDGRLAARLMLRELEGARPWDAGFAVYGLIFGLAAEGITGCFSRWKSKIRRWWGYFIHGCALGSSVTLPPRLRDVYGRVALDGLSGLRSSLKHFPICKEATVSTSLTSAFVLSHFIGVHVSVKPWRYVGT